MKIRRLQSLIAEHLFGRSLKIVASAALVFHVGIQNAAAVDYNWTNTNSNWNASTSWSEGIPTSVNTTGLIFGGTTAYTATNDIGAFTLNKITVSNTAATIIDGGAGLNFAGTSPAITINAGSGATTISGPIATSVATAVTNNSSNLLMLSGAISPATFSLTIGGTGNTTVSGAIGGTATTGLIKNGAGTLTLSGANTYTGATTLSAGTLVYAANPVTSTTTANGAFANGTITSSPIGTGVLTVAGGATLTVDASRTMRNTLTISGTTATPSIVSVPTGTEFTTTGALNGGATAVVNKTGTGLWRITFGSATTGAASSVGTLNINAGTVMLTDPIAGATGGGDFAANAINVNSGGAFVFGNTTPYTGENPDLPDATYITVNTGGTYTNNVGENFGGVILQGGTTTFGVAGATITAAGTTPLTWTSGTLNGLAASFSSAAVITKTTASTLTLAGGAVLTGAGAFNIQGGTVAVTGTSTFGGTAALNVQNGTLQYLADANFTTTRPITLGDTTNFGILEYQGATPAAAKAQVITLNAGGGSVRVTTTAANLNLSGIIGGAGALTKQGTGILTLSGNNNYSGGTIIPTGTANTVGGIAITNAAGLGTGDLTVGTAGPSAAAPASGNLPFLNVNTAAAITVANNISLPTTPTSATVYSLQKTGGTTTANGTNVLLSGTISGGNANTTLMFNSSLGSDFSTSYQLSGTNTSLAGKVRVNRGSLIVDNASALGSATLELGTNTNAVLTTGGNLRLNGAFTLPNNITIVTGTNTISSMGNTAGISGGISGTVAWGKIGTGTLVLTGNNTISGALSILEGTVQVGDGTTTGVLSPASVINNGALAFNRSDSVTYSGVVSGAGVVNQIGTGTTILTGTNTFTGGTTISAGTLQVGSGSTAGVLPGNVTNNGTLAFNRSDAVTFAGAISGTGSVTQSGAGTTTLTGTLSYAGATTVSTGVLKITPFGTTSGTTVSGGAGLTIVNGAVPAIFTTPTLSLGASGTTLRFDAASNNPTVPLIDVTTIDGLNLNSGTHTLTLTNSSTFSVGQFTLIDYPVASSPITSGFTLSALPGRTAGNLVYNTANTSIDLNVTGADTITYTGAIDNNWDVGTAVDTGGTMNFKVVGLGPNNGNATNFIDADSVRFDDTAAGPTTPFDVNLTTAVQPLIVTVENSTNNYTFQGTGSLAGSGVLTKLGSGSLTLLTDNTYTGTTTVTAGTIQVGNGGTTGSLGTGAVVNNSALIFNRSDDISIPNAISGTGTLTKNGTNTLTLTGAYTSTGNTTLDGGLLTLSTTASYTYGGAIGGAGGLTKLGTGTVTLNGDNLYTGPTTVTAGTLQFGNGGTTGSLVTDAAVAGTIAFNRSDAYTYGGVISGAGAISKLGAGTLILTKDNTLTGTTTITAGTVQLGNGGTTGNLAGPVTGAGTLAFNRSDDFAFANVLSGALTVTKTGSNTVTLSGTNTYTGGLNITQGVVSISAAANTGAATAPVTINGGTLRVTASHTNTQNINFGTNGGTIQIDPDVDFVKGTNANGLSGSTLTITGGGTLGLQGSGFSTISNVIVDNGVYRHTSARYVAANTTPYTVTVNPGGTLFNLDTTSFTGTAYFPFGNTTGVTGSMITLNGDGYALGGNTTGTPSTTMFGAYLHALSEASSAGTNSATSNINVPVFLAGTSRFTLAIGSNGTRNTTTDRIVDSLIGGVSGPGGLIADGDGNGTLVIGTSVPTPSGAATYSGSTRVANGTLRIGLDNALPTGTTLTLGGTTGDNVPNSSGTFELNAKSQTVAGLATLGSGTANRIGNSPTADGALTVNYNGTNPQTFSGQIGYTGFRNLALTKDGTGTLNLTGANDLTRTVTVAKGTLAVSGSGSIALAPTITVAAGANFDVSGVTGGANFDSGTSQFALQAGQTLNGSGTITGGVTLANGSTLSPGNSPGTMNTGNMTWATGANYNWQARDLSSSTPSGSNFDSLVVSGTLTINTGFNFNLWSLATVGPDTNGDAIFNNGANGFWRVASATTLVGAGNLGAPNISAMNGTGGFSNNLAGGSFSLVTGDTTGILGATANDIYLKFASAITTSGTTYTLAAAPGITPGTTPGTLNILKGGSLTATSTITNTGLSANNADTLSYTALSGTSGNTGVATVSGTSASGTPLANGNTAAAQSLVITGVANGSTTIAADGGTVKNAALNTAATLSGSAGTINVVVGNATYASGDSTTFVGSTTLSASTPGGFLYNDLSSTTVGLTSSGTSVPSLGTTASILLYDNVNNSDSGFVNMQWRSRTAAEASNKQSLGDNGTAAVGYLLSDVVNITGMDNGNGFTDTFILQMNYNEALLDGHEVAGVNHGNIFIAWKSGNNWVNAVTGNSTTAAHYFPNQAYDASARVLGDYGIDPGTNTVWAVLNHNSEFAVIPEPSTLVLGGLALLGFAGVALRRRRMVASN